MATPTLPPRFPCWVRATYSWGGESKRDLGFMEGDLIECLNAGDGMWWMGRLRRDRRMVGLFPSNFVKLLDDDFQPAPRSSLNTPNGSISRPNSTTHTPALTPQPSKSLFRKPFSGYAMAGAPNPEAAARDIRLNTPNGTPSPKNSVQKMKTMPFSSMHKPKSAPATPQAPRPRAPSPTIPAPIARASSPLPRASSPPPPAPPPHRHAYMRQTTPEPQESYSGGFTPSPLRDAMNDVMHSLESMGEDYGETREYPDQSYEDSTSYPSQYDSGYHTETQDQPEFDSRKSYPSHHNSAYHTENQRQFELDDSEGPGNYSHKVEDLPMPYHHPTGPDYGSNEEDQGVDHDRRSEFWAQDDLSTMTGPSATSAGSLARRRNPQPVDIEPDGDGGLLGGLAEPVAIPKKRSFFGKVKDSIKSGAATVRSRPTTPSSSRPGSRQKSYTSQGISSATSRPPSRSAANEMGLGGTSDWVNMRRDVNRSNSLSRNERNERVERCQMSDIPVLYPVETLSDSIEGDEDMHGQPVRDPTDIAACNFTMVDKSARFVNNLPALINPSSLAQGYLCRPFKSDVQKLRAIFTWVAERVTWEEDYEGDIDTRRVIMSKRGCSEEIAVLVAEMCSAIGLYVEIVRGHLKIPGELSLDQDLNDAAARPNHWWNAVIADGEWRILDCSLANPTHPKRVLYCPDGTQMAESWWFLTRPSEICYTHVPLLPEQQHMVPYVAHDVLMALPIASPPYFRHQLQMWDFDTSLLSLEGLDMAHVQLTVPEDVECIATVSTRSLAHDLDGDAFESGDLHTTRVLAQGDFISVGGVIGGTAAFKRYTIKAFVPVNSPDDGSAANGPTTATLNIYAGRRGLMHSIHSNTHPLALSLPLIHHGGQNPSFDFFTRHPTPHALRHELYVTGPLCRRLAYNNTFVFSVRQHPSSANWTSVEKRPSSPRPSSAMSVARPTSAMSIARPTSAMSMASFSVTGSNYSNSSDGSNSSGGAAQPGVQKPAKLAMQSPSGKILRMTRKADPRGRQGMPAVDEDGVTKCGSNWETIIKIGERGTWRALVLADRSARWCVFGEWECF